MPVDQKRLEEIVRLVISVAEFAAARTATTTDDKLVGFAKSILNNPIALGLLMQVLEKILNQQSPEADPVAAVKFALSEVAADAA